MKLRVKLPFVTSIIVFIAIVTVTIYSAISFLTSTEKSIEIYRVEETEKILNNLKDIVNIAYSMIDYSYKSSSKEGIFERYGLDITDSADATIKMIAMNMLNLTKENLRVLRFGVDGYIWINDFEKPYTVRLHPIRPELEGHDWVFYIEDKDVNVYQAFHDTIIAGEGEGKVTYDFYKPGTNERVPKLSFVKLYAPLGWVIGTGVYIDHINKIVAKKKDEMNAQIINLILGVAFIGIIIILVSAFSLYLFGESITKPIYQIEKQLSQMSKGKIVEKLAIKRHDEIGNMKKSLDELIDGFRTYSEFALEIGQRNFKSDFQTLSKEDVIGNSLIQMRESLKAAEHKENIRKEENARRQWIAEGLTLLGDILRINSGNLRILSEQVLVKLLSYLDANQGGIFILNEEDKNNIFLELYAAVAYSRKKFLTKKIPLNEGLIGACFLEREKIYITNLPENYVEINSGLGTAQPRNLILVPLMLEDNIFGVIELASFNMFNQYEIEFIERVAQSIAVSISTSKAFYSDKNVYN